MRLGKTSHFIQESIHQPRKQPYIPPQGTTKYSFTCRRILLMVDNNKGVILWLSINLQS